MKHTVSIHLQFNFEQENDFNKIQVLSIQPETNSKTLQSHL